MYSTCTIFREENQRVVERFLDAHENFELDKELAIIPGINGNDGFYLARLVRK